MESWVRDLYLFPAFPCVSLPLPCVSPGVNEEILPPVGSWLPLRFHHVSSGKVAHWLPFFFLEKIVRSFSLTFCFTGSDEFGPVLLFLFIYWHNPCSPPLPHLRTFGLFVC